MSSVDEPSEDAIQYAPDNLDPDLLTDDYCNRRILHLIEWCTQNKAKLSIGYYKDIAVDGFDVETTTPAYFITITKEPLGGTPVYVGKIFFPWNYRGVIVKQVSDDLLKKVFT